MRRRRGPAWARARADAPARPAGAGGRFCRAAGASGRAVRLTAPFPRESSGPP